MSPELQLKKHWKHYLAAYDAYPYTPIQQTSTSKKDDYNKWLDAAVSEWQTVYSANQHAKVSSTVKQRDILHAWVKHETSIHSGKKYKFRTTVGGADDLGSMGFSQVKNVYVYGPSTACSAFQNINLYHPEEGMKAFAIWSNDPNCGIGFNMAFVQKGYDSAYSADPYTMVIGYASESDSADIPRNLIDVYGSTVLPDNFERLSKGITAYNRGVNGSELKKKNWAEILKTISVPIGAVKDRQPTHGIWYSISIRKDADSSKSLLRKYLWVVKKDKIDPLTNLPVKDAQGKTIRVDDFCFEYGESDWLAGTTWQSKHDKAKAGTTGVVKTCPN